MRSMTPAAALSALALALVSRAAPSFVPPPLDSPVSAGFPYGSQKVRGVNLGGWLVMEPWITPSIFDAAPSGVVDEWTFCSLQNKATAQSILTNHWNTWITESDFAAIAAAGLNHVRVPIGFWAFDVSGGEPYCQGQLPYLQKAVTWAGNHGLKVIVDLHGAPGSQNGFDNSGHRGAANWPSSSSNVQRTSAIIKTLAGMFKNNVNVVPVIQPLNEPAGYAGGNMLSTIRQFYYDSYGNVRFPNGNNVQSNTVLMIHDAFQGTSYWSGFMPNPQWQGVILDTHIYQVFSNDENARNWDAHISSACSNAGNLGAFESQLWTVVGEWSPASTDCAKYLNGKGVGSRYDGSYSGSPYVGSCTGKTGSASSFSSDYKTFLRKYWEAQVQSYEAGAGWIMWAWKAENADDWSYQAGLKNGWIPSNPTNYQYPNICG